MGGKEQIFLDLYGLHCSGPICLENGFKVDLWTCISLSSYLLAQEVSREIQQLISRKTSKANKRYVTAFYINELDSLFFF